MRKSGLFCGGLALVACMLSARSAAAETVLVGSFNLVADSNTDNTTIDITTLPSSGGQLITRGPYTASVTYDLSDAALNASFAMSRSGDPGLESFVSGGFFLSVTVPTQYTVSGQITGGSATGDLYLSAYVIDTGVVNGSLPFYFQHINTNQGSATLVLGSGDGTSGFQDGPVTGILYPGIAYEYGFLGWTLNNGDGGGLAASAEGFVNLTLSPAVSTPLPGAAVGGLSLLGGLGGSSVLGRRRRAAM